MFPFAAKYFGRFEPRYDILQQAFEGSDFDNTSHIKVPPGGIVTMAEMVQPASETTLIDPTYVRPQNEEGAYDDSSSG